MEKMLQSMMKRFPLFIAMGFMMVMIAVIIAAVNSANAASYYAVDKAARDASVQLAQVRRPARQRDSRYREPSGLAFRMGFGDPARNARF